MIDKADKVLVPVLILLLILVFAVGSPFASVKKDKMMGDKMDDKMKDWNRLARVKQQRDAYKAELDLIKDVCIRQLEQGFTATYISFIIDIIDRTPKTGYWLNTCNTYGCSDEKASHEIYCITCINNMSRDEGG